MNLLKEMIPYQLYSKNEFLAEQQGAKSNVNAAKLNIKADFHFEIKTVPRLSVPRLSANRAFQLKKSFLRNKRGIFYQEIIKPYLCSPMFSIEIAVSQ